jgi:predicted transcriptional regulator
MPKKDTSKRFIFRLDTTTADALQELARQTERSRAAVLRHLVKQEAKRLNRTMKKE